MRSNREEKLLSGLGAMQHAAILLFVFAAAELLLLGFLAPYLVSQNDLLLAFLGGGVVFVAFIPAPVFFLKRIITLFIKRFENNNA
ncbi:MAG: hypothetical protein IBX56_20120 [Methylomicrobium sp.]|nr:hypothetical protein [Methylomicrobium sp.]